MGRFLGSLAVPLAALLLCPAARAQPCCPPDPWAAPPAPAARPAFDPLPPFAVELLGGQASGVRLQVPVIPGENGAVVAEGFYGYLDHDLASSWALGAGGRFLWREPVDGWNSVVLGAGVGVYFHLDDGEPVVLTPSLNLGLMHAITAGTAFEVGVEGGLGIGVAGRTGEGEDALGEVTPIISGYIGLRF
ncbi:MAG: hypothetical protein ACRC33_20195 [Gemmataceae bacterium]